MNNVYMIDVDNYMISHISTSIRKFDKIFDNMNEVLDDNEVFTIGCGDKEKLIKELENIIKELKEV